MLVHIEQGQTTNPYFEEFLHSFQERRLRFYATELQQTLELPELQQLEDALSRAMNVCRSQQLELSAHFKPIYRCEESGVIKDWKLSPLAWCLVMINANPAHPEVARMQLTLIERGFKKE